MAQTHLEKSAPVARKKWFFLLNLSLALALIFAGAGLLIWRGWAAPEEVNPADYVDLKPGSMAPAFSLPALTGEQVALSDYQGQVVLVNLWATWCGPCKAEMPTLNAFYEAHKADGFVVLAINNKDDATVAASFAREYGLTFPVLLDPQGQVSDLYTVFGLPTSFIIDREGVIQHVQMGEMTAEQLEAVVGPLL